MAANVWWLLDGCEFKPKKNSEITELFLSEDYFPLSWTLGQEVQSFQKLEDWAFHQERVTKKKKKKAIIFSLVEFDLRKNSLSSDVIFGCGF